jgi:hypothetical protein
MARNPRGPVERWHSIFSLEAQLAMTEKVETVCREAEVEARERMKYFPSPGLRGQLRYYELSDGVFDLGLTYKDLQSDLELHLGNVAKFPVVKRNEAWVTFAKLSQWAENPFARPFRRGGEYLAKGRRFQGGQIPLIKAPRPPKGRLIVAVCYGFFKGVSHAAPSFIEARFADEQWQCCDSYVDLYAQLKDSRHIHTEVVDDTPDVTPRVTPEIVPENRESQERQDDTKTKDDEAQ